MRRSTWPARHELLALAGYKVEHSLSAHAGGLAALDARGNFVATCGYSMRQGQLAQDPMVKVSMTVTSVACIVA